LVEHPFVDEISTVMAVAPAVALVGGRLGGPPIISVLAVAGCVALERALHHRYGDAAEATPSKAAFAQ
jgi:hypothetical protein